MRNSIGILLLIAAGFLASETVQAELNIFAAIGDHGEDDSDNTSVAVMVDGWQPDFVITLGDNRYDDNLFDVVVGGRYCDFLADVNGGISCPTGTSPTNAFFPSIGNHEFSDGGGIAEYLEYFLLPGNGVPSSNTSGNERYYDFIQGSVHFFVVNSDAGEPDGNTAVSVQAQWLQSALIASTTPWQVVYFHNAPYASSIASADFGMRWPFAAWGADAVFYGHRHIYERMEVDGIPYFLNGLGGRVFSPEIIDTPIPESRELYADDFGAMRVYANEIGMSFEFRSIDDGSVGQNGGLLIDGLTIGEIPVLLDEHFSSGNGNAANVLPDWSIVDEGVRQAPSRWTVAGRQLRQTSNIRSRNLDRNALPKLGTYLTHESGNAWADYRLQVVLRSDDDDAIGVMFRVQDTDNYYRFSWDSQRAYRRVVKREGGVFTLLAEDAVPYVPGQAYNLEVSVEGSAITVIIDGVEVFAIDDTSFTNGGIAFYSWANSASIFDDVLVENLGGSSVNSSPGVVITGPTSGGNVTVGDAVTFTGTAGDDEDGDISNGLSWSSNIDGTIGVGATFEVDTLAVGNHTITASASDSGGLTGTDTVTLAVNPLGGSLPLLDESFDINGGLTAVYPGWRVVDEGSLQAPSSWNVVGAQLQQSSNIRSDNLDRNVLPKLGSYVVYDPSSTWSNYRLRLTLRSDDDDAFGVMFRVQDSNNYYRFSWDSQRAYRRIVKNEGGVFTLLAEDAVPYIPGQTYDFEVTALGNAITVLIDGVVVFALNDPSIASGGIALYGWANSESIYDSVVAEDLGVSTGNAFPIVVIESPANGSNVTVGDTVTFTGTVSDNEDGDISNGLGWSSNIDGVIGFGATFDVSTLAVGNHTITASASDSGGLSDSDTMALAVNPLGGSLPLLDESFATNGGLTAVYPGWSVVDEGTRQAPSSWNVVGAQLQQSSNIRSDNLDRNVLPKLGSYVLYNPSIAWSDYRLQLTMRSDDDDAFGVMFRVQDTSNYYRFSWDSQRAYRRIVKNEGGVFTLLAEDAVPYVPGQAYSLEVSAQGDAIFLSIDGVEIFSINDASFASGGIGLYGWANSASTFDDLIVLVR